MKQGRIIGIIFAAVNVILIIICAVLYLRTDRTPPEIEFYASKAVYVEGEENSGLLEGASARDSVDGDITGRIVIEKVIEDRETNSVVVYYAVSDLSGNVAKASRVFDAVYIEEEKEEISERFPEAGIDAEMSLHDKVQTIVKDEGTEDEPEEIDEHNETREREDPAPVPTKTPEKTAEPTAEAPPITEPVRTPVPTIDPSVPILTLKVSEVKVPAGQGPAWVDLIGKLSDDKDNYETLFHNLSVSKYDRNKAGSYAVSVHTEDSDGNQSQSVPLTIIVE